MAARIDLRIITILSTVSFVGATVNCLSDAQAGAVGPLFSTLARPSLLYVGNLMKRLILWSALALGTLGGCATTVPNAPLTVEHPAHVDAAVAAVPPRSTVLQLGHESVLGTPTGGRGAASRSDHEPESGHAHHGSAGGASGGAERPGRGGASAPVKAVYTCPHHPEVVSDAPGACPKCEMKLRPMKGATESSPSASKEQDGQPAGAAHQHEGHE